MRGAGERWQVNTKQIIPKTLIQEAILNPPVTSWGSTQFLAPVEDQFVKYTYPIPKEEGGSEIHMIWTDTPCRLPAGTGEQDDRSHEKPEDRMHCRPAPMA